MIKSVAIKLYSRYFIPVVFFLIPFSLQAQYHFEGRVLDAETELPINSFVVQADSTEYQFTSGTFHLETSNLPVLLTFKAKGYYLFSLPVSSEATKINIRLIPENINIHEIVVKAFQSGKRLLDTPGSIEIITNRQLLREPAFTLAPSVNKMAGVWMQSGSINTNRLTIRGIGTRSPYGSNKIRAYYGDIPLTNGVGETTLEDLDLEQIADIEIIKGPSSGFYGSGLGGVLLFNPAKPVKDMFVQQVSAGSFQTIRYTGKLVVAGQNSAHSLVYSRLHSDGYRENNETNRHNLTWTSTFTRSKLPPPKEVALISVSPKRGSTLTLFSFTFFLLLMTNVSQYHVLIQSNGTYEVTLCPKVIAPVWLLF